MTSVQTTRATQNSPRPLVRGHKTTAHSCMHSNHITTITFHVVTTRTSTTAQSKGAYYVLYHPAVASFSASESLASVHRLSLRPSLLHKSKNLLPQINLPPTYHRTYVLVLMRSAHLVAAHRSHHYSRHLSKNVQHSLNNLPSKRPKISTVPFPRLKHQPHAINQTPYWLSCRTAARFWWRL